MCYDNHRNFAIFTTKCEILKSTYSSLEFADRDQPRMLQSFLFGNQSSSQSIKLRLLLLISLYLLQQQITAEMGNNQGMPDTDPELQTQSQSRDIKLLTQQADKMSNSLSLDTYSASVIRRIFVQRRQTHLLDTIRKVGTKEKVQLFLDQVHCANLEILDSFYEHIVRSSCDIRVQKDQVQLKKKIIAPFDRQIGICGSMDIMKERSWSPISDQHCEIVDLTKGTRNIPGYEYYKERGLEAIKNEQVCFIILAGGRNLRYDLNEYKECDPLTQLPSQSSLIQIFLKKFQALGKLINAPIHIYIMVNNEDHKRKIRKIKSLKIPNPEYIQIDFLTQINYGCLDLSGKLVLADNKEVFMHPNGNGDLWANFQPKNIEKLKLNKFKYFQIFGVSNMLEHCFDCYMIGKLIHERLPWVTMCKHDPNSRDADPVMFINSDKTIHVRDPQQIGSGMDSNNLAYFPPNCPHTFLQNSVFSLQFIQMATKSPGWLQHRKYHCKLKRIDHRAPLSNYGSILVFERQITDILAITPLQQDQQTNISKMKSRGAVILMKQNIYHSPFYTKYDKLVGIVSRSEMHKSWLNIGEKDDNQQKNRDYIEQKLNEICEIDPTISLQGQNLEQITKQLADLNGKISYPLYIADETYQEGTTNQNMGSTLKESKFANLNYFTDGI